MTWRARHGTDAMLATVTGPIVTDFVPAVKPPWMVLATVLVLVLAFIPRESLGLALLALAGLGAMIVLIVRRYRGLAAEQ
jgi:hypothetical protein